MCCLKVAIDVIKQFELRPNRPRRAPSHIGEKAIELTEKEFSGAKSVMRLRFILISG